MSSHVRQIVIIALICAMASALTDGASAATASVTYTYDQVGRLATALYDNGVCVVYNYDASGNRTAQTNTLSGAPATPIWGTGVWGCFKWTP